jgi:diaminopimelate epimerase
VEFCTIKDAHNIRMRVWERGAGITQACGSGACAVLAAAARRGLVKDWADIHLDGGILRIEWAGGGTGVLMAGPTELSFSGIIGPGLLSSGA